MTDIAALLAAYDENTRARVPNPQPAGVHYERDGALLRTIGQYRGFVETPRDCGVRGAELDALIARQRDYFAARGEAVEWKTRAHDLPGDLTDRLTAGADAFMVFVAEVETPNGPQVVCAAWLTLREGFDFAGFWGGSTLAEYRRRGIYRAMVARRAQIAAGQGVKYVQVDASENSRPILQRLGLRAVTTTTPYVWSPA